MRVDDFDFELPPELIAQRPIRPRDAARMLWVPAGAEEFADRTIADLPHALKPGDIMVFNNTRVIPARLAGHRRGAKVEVTLHLRVSENTWRVFARPAKKLKMGDRIDFAAGFWAEVADKRDGGEVTLAFNLEGPGLRAALDKHGVMPLPPYIKRAKEEDGLTGDHDREDYQTLYAVREGAVAAPTAGLHFTQALMDKLETRGIRRAMVTLHVGAGTFLPVKVDDTDDHAMHSEWGEISEETARAVNDARKSGGRVIAVGTTSLRLLESAADETGHLHPFQGETDIFITPGYTFRITDLLLTNFHLPRSTLFMLVAAFSGLGPMTRAYNHAKQSGYRFYSYGDCCLLQRAETP
ncbi:MAG: tRNA preQ1(34) S-adenosylmethionine ribosyltransferase-isomerase QueA [Rhodospirillales bacterium]|nr:tRNA preQ1(34) S-adenosylmethionine ribosyltransferase-isomerase QueA [Rhodospirillales bacterium]